MAKENKVSIVTELLKPIAEQAGVAIWDVRFEKEGATWYLRIFIEKEEGIEISDLENVSRALDEILDSEDPIDQSYVLEVSSPGLMRDLVKTEHLIKYMGSEVDVRFFKAVDGVKDFIGTLSFADDKQVKIILEEDEVELCFERKEAAFIRVHEEL